MGASSVLGQDRGVVSTARGVVRLIPMIPGVLAGLLAWGTSARAACPEGRAAGARGDALVVGYAVAPPFVTATPSCRAASGIAIDLLCALATDEGWRLELVELSPATLRARLAACELDIGVLGAPVSATLAAQLELSQPYFSTVATAIVHGDDSARAGPGAGQSRGGRIAGAALRGLLWAAVGLGLLCAASWLLNAFTGVPGAGGVRRRLDAAVSGPSTSLGWLTRSTTGRLLALAWALAGLGLGASRVSGLTPALALGDDPLSALVEQAARTEDIVGERYPDGAHVSCSGDALRTCFHSFADGTLSAIAGPREVLCQAADELSLDGAALREDLAIAEQYAYLVPPGSRLRGRLDLALLRYHEHARVDPPVVRCPGAGAGAEP